MVANGTLRAHFDGEQKLELLEFVTSSHEEYVPRSMALEAARPFHNWTKDWKNMNTGPDGKPSPEMNKKKQKMMKSPQNAPPDFDLPGTKLKANFGITPAVFRYLEVCCILD